MTLEEALEIGAVVYTPDVPPSDSLPVVPPDVADLAHSVRALAHRLEALGCGNPFADAAVDMADMWLSRIVRRLWKLRRIQRLYDAVPRLCGRPVLRSAGSILHAAS